MISITIAKDFSKTPGLRYKSQSEFSGEVFRTDYLVPKFDEAVTKNEKLVVNLDGTAGYTTSFLEESFGGLAREKGVANVKKNLELVSNEETYLVNDIWGYINNVEDK